MESITCIVLESHEEVLYRAVQIAADAAELVVLRSGEVVKDRLGLFLETNVKEHAPSPAGASVDSSGKPEPSPTPENRAAGDGCVTRLVRCSSSSPVEWAFPNECGEDTGSGVLRIPDAPSVLRPANGDEDLTGDLRQ